jgi:hypothetical protein
MMMRKHACHVHMREILPVDHLVLQAWQGVQHLQFKYIDLDGNRWQTVPLHLFNFGKDIDIHLDKYDIIFISFTEVFILLSKFSKAMRLMYTKLQYHCAKVIN